jgi:hypothetical protein
MSTSSPPHDVKTGYEEKEHARGPAALGNDDEFGGTEERARMEKSLLRRLDFRISILIVIYILNYVRFIRMARGTRELTLDRLTATTPRTSFPKHSQVMCLTWLQSRSSSGLPEGPQAHGQ